MIYKHMYCGYKNSGKVQFKENQQVITASAATHENITFVYFESNNNTLGGILCSHI